MGTENGRVSALRKRCKMFLINFLGRLWFGSERWDLVNEDKTPMIYTKRAHMTPLQRLDFEELTGNDRYFGSKSEAEETA